MFGMKRLHARSVEQGEAQGRLKNREPVAVIDIGSNSVRLVIFEGLVRSPSILFNEKVACGLGRGMDKTNRMDEAAVESALAALRRYRVLAVQARARHMFVLATAAAREAENGADFIERAEAILDQPIRILTGPEEALYSAYGVLAAFRKPFGVAGDLGGGSLELIDIENQSVGKGITMPLGVIRLQDRSGSDVNKAFKLADEDLASKGDTVSGEGRDFFAIGGTWRNLAKLHMAATDYPLLVTHNYAVEPADLEPFLDTLMAGNIDKLKGIDEVSKSRRALIPYGAAVLKAVIAHLKPGRILFSAYGVREGYLYSQLDDETQARDALIEAADEMAVLRARSPRHARELADWTARAFDVFGIGETEDEARYREAACRLADTGWRAHPDYRDLQSLAVTAYGHFVQVSHQGRAYIALASYFRYQGLKAEDHAPEIRTLTTDRIWFRARALAAFFRVAYIFTAAMPGVLDDLHWEERGDGTVCLVIPSDLADLAGERPKGRLNQLGKVLGRDLDMKVLED